MAIQLLSMMSFQRLVPDEVSFNSLISVCEQCSQWRVAVEVFAEILESQLLPTLISFNSTISACSKGSELSKSLALMGSMKEYQVRADIVSYNSIISANVGQVNAWQKTWEMLDNLILGMCNISCSRGNDIVAKAG